METEAGFSPSEKKQLMVHLRKTEEQTEASIFLPPVGVISG